MENEVNISRQPAPLTEEEKQIRLQRRQKDTLDKFLARNAISRQQYEAGMKYIEEQGRS